MTDIFSTREIAIGIWIIIGLGLFSSFVKVRKSLLQLIKAAMNRHMVSLYLALSIYCGMVVYALYQANFWQWSFLKDTIVWAVLSGFGILMRHKKNIGFKKHVKDYLRDAISMTVIVVFISSAYTFNIWIELFSIPILVILGATQAYAERDTRAEYKTVVRFLQGAFVVYGLIAIIFSLHGVIVDYQEFFTTETLRNFLLPIVLLIAFVPFYYTFVLYTSYETVFIQLKWPTRDDRFIARRVKRNLYKYVGINLFKLERFCRYKKYANPLLKTKEDVDHFFKWLSNKDIEKILKKHNELSIDDLPWDAMIKVTLKDGAVLQGAYGHWNNAYHSSPKGESIYVIVDDVEHELLVDEIVEIKQIGSFNP